jgi:hypothetical protein
MHDPIRSGDFIDGVFDLNIAYEFAARIGPNFLHSHTLEVLLGDGFLSHRCSNLPNKRGDSTINGLVGSEPRAGRRQAIFSLTDTHTERAWIVPPEGSGDKFVACAGFHAAAFWPVGIVSVLACFDPQWPKLE